MTIPLCTSRIHSSARGDQLHSTRWSDISRLDTSRLLSERSTRIDATLAVNKPTNTDAVVAILRDGIEAVLAKPALGRPKVRRELDKDAKRIRQLRDEGQSYREI